MNDEAVELLTVDDDGHAIEGPKFPIDRGPTVIYEYDHESTPPDRRAYLHKFFRYDKHGHPVPETLVKFFVPDWMCDGTAPSRVALRAVAERMGRERRM